MTFTRLQFQADVGCKATQIDHWLSAAGAERDADGMYSVKAWNLSIVREHVRSDLESFLASRGVVDPIHVDLASRAILALRRTEALQK